MRLKATSAKPLQGILFVAVLLLGSTLPAAAAVFIATLQDVTFEDGGVATGFFRFDTNSNTVLNWSISVAGGSTPGLPPFTYDPSNSSSSVGTGDLGLPLTDFTFSTPDRRIGLLLANTFPASGGSDPLVIWPAGQGGHESGFECTQCNSFRNFASGSIVAELVPPAPVPALDAPALALLCVALAALGVTLVRARR